MTPDPIAAWRRDWLDAARIAFVLGVLTAMALGMAKGLGCW